MVTIGIDLGNTYSCAAIFRNGVVEVIPNEGDKRLVPSYIAFTKNERLYGDAAKFQASVNFVNTVNQTKKLLGRSFNEVSKDKSLTELGADIVNIDSNVMIQVQYKGELNKFRPEQLVAMLIRHIKDFAESYLKTTITDAVVSVPAQFTNAQREAIEDAVFMSGLNLLELINESTAAAIAYGFNLKVNSKHNILIFDFGGGSLEVAVVCIEDRIYRVKACDGDLNCGGDDFDTAIMNYFIRELAEKNEQNVSLESRSKARLRVACEATKRRLTKALPARIEVDSLTENKDFSSTIDRNTFEKENNHIFEKIRNICKNVVQQSGISKYEIDEIVLVGGSTRVSKIRKLLLKEFNKKELNGTVNPDEAVAQGVAIYAAFLKGDKKAQEKLQKLEDNTVYPANSRSNEQQNIKKQLNYNMKKMVEQIDECDKKDREWRQQSSEKNALEGYVYKVKHDIRQRDRKTKNDIMKKCSEIIQFLDSNTVVSTVDLNHYRNQLSSLSGIEPMRTKTDEDETTITQSKPSCLDSQPPEKKRRKYIQDTDGSGKRAELKAITTKMSQHVSAVMAYCRKPEHIAILPPDDLIKIEKHCEETNILLRQNELCSGDIEKKEKQLEKLFRHVSKIVERNSDEIRDQELADGNATRKRKKTFSPDINKTSIQTSPVQAESRTSARTKSSGRMKIQQPWRSSSPEVFSGYSHEQIRDQESIDGNAKRERRKTFSPDSNKTSNHTLPIQAERITSTRDQELADGNSKGKGRETFSPDNNKSTNQTLPVQANGGTSVKLVFRQTRGTSSDRRNTLKAWRSSSPEVFSGYSHEETRDQESIDGNAKKEWRKTFSPDSNKTLNNTLPIQAEKGTSTRRKSSGRRKTQQAWRFSSPGVSSGCSHEKTRDQELAGGYAKEEGEKTFSPDINKTTKHTSLIHDNGEPSTRRKSSGRRKTQKGWRSSSPGGSSGYTHEQTRDQELADGNATRPRRKTVLPDSNKTSNHSLPIQVERGTSTRDQELADGNAKGEGGGTFLSVRNKTSYHTLPIQARRETTKRESSRGRRKVKEEGSINMQHQNRDEPFHQDSRPQTTVKTSHKVKSTDKDDHSHKKGRPSNPKNSPGDELGSNTNSPTKRKSSRRLRKVKEERSINMQHQNRDESFNQNPGPQRTDETTHEVISTDKGHRSRKKRKSRNPTIIPVDKVGSNTNSQLNSKMGTRNPHDEYSLRSRNTTPPNLPWNAPPLQRQPPVYRDRNDEDGSQCKQSKDKKKKKKHSLLWCFGRM